MQDNAKKTFVQDTWQSPRNTRTLQAYMALRNSEIGERLARLREQRGNPPQEVVAHKIGCANRSYQAWEAGETKPSWRNLEKLATFYGVSEEFILTGEELAAPTSDNRTLGQRLQMVEETQQRVLEHLDELADQLGALSGKLVEWQGSMGRPATSLPPPPPGIRQSPREDPAPIEESQRQPQSA